MSDGALMSRGTRGIVFVLLGMASFSTQDMVIKFLSGDYPLHEIILFRASLALGFTLFLVRMEGGFGMLRTRRPLLHLFRGLLVVVANMSFFTAFAAMKLADATALFFVAPLFITMLSAPILGEPVGPRRWAAVGAGMAGVVVMTRPGTGLFDPVAILPVIAAFAYAMNQMVTRRLGVTDRASVMSFYINLTFIAVNGAAGLILGDGWLLPEGAGPSLEFLLRPWVLPSMADAPLFLAIGLLSASGGYCVSEAYRVASPPVVAPFEYAELALAVFWGLVVFHEAPDLFTVGGVALIAGGGLYVFWREARLARAVASARPTPRNR